MWWKIRIHCSLGDQRKCRKTNKQPNSLKKHEQEIESEGYSRLETGTSVRVGALAVSTEATRQEMVNDCLDVQGSHIHSHFLERGRERQTDSKVPSLGELQ